MTDGEYILLGIVGTIIVLAYIRWQIKSDQKRWPGMWS